ncbi:type I restriction endonuclease subunit R [Chryseobacterium sp. SL1]|uniref:type I restriction endonuclease subunit R n=1 Tax=Chryseobacterium sp. SL1 TaxID=2995159 RepID=UPI00227460F6|nr:type I restriction endonuclease subunit R [Chryseobacterium sp. SL1]MCY1660901.1 type I restriction endonuclease subunit R [Chryseobacterium sp. SL1]
MRNSISENEIEGIALGYLQSLGYNYLNGLVISPDGEHPERQYTDVVLATRLRDAIDKLNPTITQDAKEDALKKVLRTESPNALINNETFHKYLTEGVDVEVRTVDGIRGEKVYIVDFENAENNEFLAINQFTIIEGSQNKRPDIILFVNGLPLVVIELKNAVDENATIKSAYNQLQTYKQAIPSLFTYNELLIVSDGWDALCGTVTSDFGRFMSWKTKDGETTADHLQPQMEVMFYGMLNKRTLLDLIRQFVVFEKSDTKTLKKVAAYHQYYAVNKAVESTVIASSSNGDRRGGVIWHTQGSGKSLSMVFYSGKLIIEPRMENPTLVILTDRNDLDEQLHETFTNCQQLLRQEPQKAEDRKDLRKLLKVASGGIVFTTIQKFMPMQTDIAQTENPNIVSEPSVEYIGADIQAVSGRKNIVVVADEAHRSQYDFIDGFAKHLRDALPNATFIGFTGTPIESTDRNTQAVFGNYVDIYDIQQAVNDKATVPIFYESRLAKVHFAEDEKVHLDEQFEELTEGEELSNRQQIRAKWTRLEAIVGNPNRIAKIAEDLVYHFEQRNGVLDGKAMIVCMSRRICVDLYNAIIKIRPLWHSDDDDKGTIKVIMTGSSSDALNMQSHIRNKPKRKAIGDRLKNPNDSLKLVIVRDMWLTGFDAPCLHTLYVDKPMRGHNLMQAIARVNRVFTEGKEGGLVVDYLGIAQELKIALAEYTASGGEGKPTLDQELAVAKMLELHEAIDYQLRHFDWKKFFTLQPEEKLKFIPVIVDYIFSQENGEQSFTDNTKNLLKAFAISVPHDKAMAIRDDVALFQAIKSRLVKISDRNEGGAGGEEMETAIKQIISEAITADNVIDIFDAAGLKKPNIEILDERFLQELKDLPQKNLAVELLKKLLKDEIKKRTKINLVESKKFSEMLEDAIKRYHNGMIDTVEFLEKVLIPFAEQIKEADKRGENLGLDYREYAFYTALEVNNTAVSVLGDEILKHIAQELLKTVRNSTTIDWTIKESVQSALRRNIRRILRLHGYPPDLQEKAVDTVISQAKMLADDIIKNDELKE